MMRTNDSGAPRHRCPKCGEWMILRYRMRPSMVDAPWEYAWTCPVCRHEVRETDKD